MENVWPHCGSGWHSQPLCSRFWLTVSVALTEIVIGAIAGNITHLQLTDWINWFAGFGAILLTVLAGVEIDRAVIKRNF